MGVKSRFARLKGNAVNIVREIVDTAEHALI